MSEIVIKVKATWLRNLVGDWLDTLSQDACIPSSQQRAVKRICPTVPEKI
jgi:hypothetical protein